MRSPLFTWGGVLFGESQDWSSPGKTRCWLWKLTWCPPGKTVNTTGHHQLGPANNQWKDLVGGKWMIGNVYVQQIIIKFIFPCLLSPVSGSAGGRRGSRTNVSWFGISSDLLLPLEKWTCKGLTTCRTWEATTSLPPSLQRRRLFLLRRTFLWPSWSHIKFVFLPTQMSFLRVEEKLPHWSGVGSAPPWSLGWLSTSSNIVRLGLSRLSIYAIRSLLRLFMRHVR